jgi:hypothetical protein
LEDFLGGFSGKPQADSIWTQLDFIIPPDLPAWAKVSLREKLIGLPCIEDTVGCEVGQIRPAFGSIGKSNLDSVGGKGTNRRLLAPDVPATPLSCCTMQAGYQKLAVRQSRKLLKTGGT